MDEEIARIAATLPPYALALGIAVERIDGGVPVLGLDFSEKVHGRPGFLHGGAIGGLLEMAAIVALRQALAQREVAHVYHFLHFAQGPL